MVKTRPYLPGKIVEHLVQRKHNIISNKYSFTEFTMRFGRMDHRNQPDVTSEDMEPTLPFTCQTEEPKYAQGRNRNE